MIFPQANGWGAAGAYGLHGVQALWRRLERPWYTLFPLIISLSKNNCKALA